MEPSTVGLFFFRVWPLPGGFVDIYLFTFSYLSGMVAV